MKHTLLSSFMLFLFSFSAYPVLRATQEGAAQGTEVPITLVGPKRSGPRTSFTDFSGISDPLRVVIRDGDAWREIWKRIHRPVTELPPLPEVDFSREMVVVAALGGRPSSTYAIIVDGAYERDERLEIAVRSVSPGKSCMTLTVCTAPVDIVRLPKTERSVVFRETEVVHECK